MIKFYRYITLIALIALVFETEGQQITIYNNNIVNPYSINPAKAGEKGNQIFIQHRNQWVGMPGSPENTLLSTEWRLKESKSSLGFNMTYDKDNIVRNTSGYITYAYHTKINAQHSLSFGLSVGARNNSIAFDEIFALHGDDPVLFGYNQTGTKFDGNLGLSYKYDHLDIQFSALQLFGGKAKYYNTVEEQEFAYNFTRHFIGSAAYTFDQVKNFDITPILQFRGAQGFNLRPEMIVKAEFQKKVWLAMQYNYKRSVALIMGMTFSEVFTVGYSAEFSTNDLVGYNGATHELVFGIKFGKAFERTETRQKLDEVSKSNSSYDERLEYLKRENDKLKKQMDEQREFYEQIKDNSSNKDYDELKQEIEELKKQQQNSKSQIVPETEEQLKVKEAMQSKASNVEFEQGNAVIKESSYESLNEVIILLGEYPEAKISIEGHTDNTGNASTNLKLSQQRADAVKDYLVKKGAAPDKVTATGKGSTEPKADNGTSDGRKANRRVEIKIAF